MDVDYDGVSLDEIKEDTKENYNKRQLEKRKTATYIQIGDDLRKKQKTKKKYNHRDHHENGNDNQTKTEDRQERKRKRNTYTYVCVQKWEKTNMQRVAS